MDFDQLIQLTQLGAIPMLTVAVAVLWRSLEATKREFIDYLKESARRGDVAAQTVLERKDAGRGNGHA